LPEYIDMLTGDRYEGYSNNKDQQLKIINSFK